MPVIDWHRIPIAQEEENAPQEEAIKFTEEEIRLAAGRLPSGKACRLDGIPNEVLVHVAYLKPSLLLNVFNACILQRVFPKIWKEARLVLLHKGPDKPTDLPSSFRPLNMLNTAGKTLERLLLARLNSHLEDGGNALFDNQYGFRSGRSTEEAIKAVLSEYENWP